MDRVVILKSIYGRRIEEIVLEVVQTLMPSCSFSDGHEHPRVDVDAGVSLVQDVRVAGICVDVAQYSSVKSGRLLRQCSTVAASASHWRRPRGGEDCRTASVAGMSCSLRIQDAAPASLQGRWPRGLHGR